MLSFLVVIVALASIVTKSVYIIKYHKDTSLTFTADDVTFLKSLGVYIEENAPYFGSMDVFMTVFFDLDEMLLGILILCLYSN
jgi:hypothetical protein